MLKAIMFDLDDTLIWDERSVTDALQKACRLAWETYAIDPKQLERNVRTYARKLFSSYDTYPFTNMIGINPLEGLWGEFNDQGSSFHRLNAIVSSYQKNVWNLSLKKFNVNDSQLAAQMAETFKAKRRQTQFVFSDTFAVLNAFYGKYRLLMLTNGAPSLQRMKLSITPELAPYFDHIVISGAFGKGKPDPAIFEHALKKLAIDSDEALMVGDNLYTDILGASKAGIPTVWIHHHSSSLSDVRPTYKISELKELLRIDRWKHRF